MHMLKTDSVHVFHPHAQMKNEEAHCSRLEIRAWVSGIGKLSACELILNDSRAASLVSIIDHTVDAKPTWHGRLHGKLQAAAFRPALA